MALLFTYQHALQDSRREQVRALTLQRDAALDMAVRPDADSVTAGRPASASASIDAIDAAARRAYVIVGCGGLLSLVLALAVGRECFGAPTAVLLRAAQGWRRGNLTERAVLPSRAAGEFRALARAFNAMAATLEQQRSEIRSLNGVMEVQMRERMVALQASNSLLQGELDEREATEGRLRQMQKLEAVGQLAGGVAHNFNNLLAAVLGSLELLRCRVAPADTHKVQLLDIATTAVEHGKRLTAMLLGFARQQPFPAMPVDAAAVIERMRGHLDAVMGPALTLRIEIAGPLWPIGMDPSQFEGLLLNLALNGRAAMQPGGVLTIAACNGAPADGRRPPGDYVQVTVSDTGCGMPEEVLQRAFEPFFTTQPVGVGAGLGLSQVHGLVQQSGGEVTIDSRPGAGTRVTMLLPRAPDMPPAPAAPAAGRTILLVDDDEIVRGVTASLLADSGYTVLQADGALPGLALFAVQAAQIGFVITDYAMPGMNGLEFLHRLRSERPQLPVLLITGYADFTVFVGGMLRPEQIVRKPFRAHELNARIRLLWHAAVPDTEPLGC